MVDVDSDSPVLPPPLATQEGSGQQGASLPPRGPIPSRALLGLWLDPWCHTVPRVTSMRGCVPHSCPVVGREQPLRCPGSHSISAPQCHQPQGTAPAPARPDQLCPEGSRGSGATIATRARMPETGQPQQSNLVSAAMGQSHEPGHCRGRGRRDGGGDT